MSRHIGIVGCSSEGAALCYRTICLEAEPFMGRHRHPEVTLHTICLADYMKHVEPQADWKKVAGMMLASAERLKRAGAEFLICPDNTIHQAMPFLVPESPLPWLHIAEEVGREARRRGFRKLGLTGTKYLVRGPVYPEKLKTLGIEYALPSEADQDQVNRIIFDELVRGRREPASVRYFQNLIEKLGVESGCDAVVLGCTELPILAGDDPTAIPALDSTRILARAALQYALE